MSTGGTIMDNLFSELEALGFKNISLNDIYEVEEVPIKNPQSPNTATLLYDTSIVCPVCENRFKEKAIKTSSYKIDSKDSDLFIRYSIINPYFFEVWICPRCGYASTKVDFHKIATDQKDLILKNISPKFKPKDYSLPYDVNTAIERYKLALINCISMKSKASRKAMICLKIAWMYRLSNNSNSSTYEMNFLEQALKGFENAYFNEIFPLYGMDKFLCMYLIGELNRRTKNYDAALNWLSNVITTKGPKQTLKDLARTQRDLIKEEMLLNKKIELETSSIFTDNNLDLTSASSHEEKTRLNKPTIFQFLKRK